MNKRELANRIKCELDVNDPAFGETLPGAAELMDKLREKGFSGEEAHLMASAPGLLRAALPHLDEEPTLEAPFMTHQAVQEMVKTVEELRKKAKHGDLRPEDHLLERVQSHLHDRLQLLAASASDDGGGSGSLPDRG